MTMPDAMAKLVEGKVWRVLGGLLATAAITIGGVLGSALLTEIKSVHDSISGLERGVASAGAELIEIENAQKDSHAAIDTILKIQREDEGKLSDALVREAATEAAVKAAQSDIQRLDAERARPGGHP